MGVYCLGNVFGARSGVLIWGYFGNAQLRVMVLLFLLAQHLLPSDSATRILDSLIKHMPRCTIVQMKRVKKKNVVYVLHGAHGRPINSHDAAPQ